MLAQVKMGGSVVALAQGGWDDVRAFAEPAMDLSTEVGDPRVWAATASFLVTAAARWVAYCCAAAGLDPPATRCRRQVPRATLPPQPRPDPARSRRPSCCGGNRRCTGPCPATGGG